MSSYDFAPPGANLFGKSGQKAAKTATNVGAGETRVAPVKVVKVRAHTRTIAVKPPPAPGVNTASVQPSNASSAKRLKPNFPGEPVAGYLPTRPLRGAGAKIGGPPARLDLTPHANPLTAKSLGLRSYYTNTHTLHHFAGPTGQESTQLNAAQVAKSHKLAVANYGGPVGYAVRSLVPGGTDQSGTTSIAGAIERGVNAASLALPGGGVGEAAGLFGLGLRGLRATKVAAKIAPKFVDTAERTGSAAALAAKHGINVADVKGTGAGGKVLQGDVAAHHFQTLPPHLQAQEGLKGARTQYGVERAQRNADKAVREKAAFDAFNSIEDPVEATKAARAALRGPYSTIDYKGLKELTPETVKVLQTDAKNHPGLGYYGKQTVIVALQRAVDEGRVPRPAEQRLIEIVVGKRNAAAIAKQAAQGWFDKTINVLNIPRALQTTLDISGVMRQNLVAMVSHPVLGVRTLPVTFKAMTAEGYDAAQKAWESNPFYALFVQHGGQITDIGEHAPLVAHEEGFTSDIAANALDKVPKVPNFIKGSARSYVATGNTMRMAAFENRMRIAIAAGDPTIHNEKTLRQIAQVINAATGRGTLPGRAEHLLPAMNTFLFSPRLMLARLHYLDPTWYFRLKGPARREALRGLLALSGSVTGALYLFSRIPGVTVGSLDPRSADFGKLKIGNTRVDIAGGFQQYVRLASELLTNTSVSSTTGKKTKLGSSFGVPTRFDVGVNFLANKTAPVVGFGIAELRGHDPIGRPLTWGSLAQNYLTPLTFQDAKDIYNDKHGGLNGLAAALAGYGVGAVGVGVQTYGPPAPTPSAPSSGSSYDFAPSGPGGGSSYDFAPSP